MDTLTLKLPTLYGDHHVIKARQVVAALPGVAAVVASAALQQLVVELARDSEYFHSPTDTNVGRA